MTRRDFIGRRVVALAAALLPFASSATIAVDVAKPPVKDQRCIRAGAGIGYSGSLGHDNWANFEQFFVKEPDKTWDVCRAGGYLEIADALGAGQRQGRAEGQGHGEGAGLFHPRLRRQVALRRRGDRRRRGGGLGGRCRPA